MVYVLYGSHCNNTESVLSRSRKGVWQLENTTVDGSDI